MPNILLEKIIYETKYANKRFNNIGSFQDYLSNEYCTVNTTISNIYFVLEYIHFVMINEYFILRCLNNTTEDTIFILK